MILALLAGLSMAGDPALGPSADQAYEAMVRLDPEAREAVVRRMMDEGLLASEDAAATARVDRVANLDSVELRLVEARRALRRAEPLEAMGWLEPVRTEPRVAPFWREAVDLHVYAERERAGRWFLYSRRLAGEEQRAAVIKARDILVDVAQDYPDSLYADAVTRALSRVELSLDAT